jgi:L-iditol 2-dehydrogenase
VTIIEPAPTRTGSVRSLRIETYSVRTALAVLAGSVREELRLGGTGSSLQLVEHGPAHRPAGWIRVRPRLAGVCRSDFKFLSIVGWGRTILAVTGLPTGVVPGHEVVGTVTEADEDGTFAVGDRVVLEPTISCEDKGLEPCRACRAGDDHVCERMAARGSQAPGPGFGHNGRYGGGWSEEVIAPARRAYQVPEGMDDQTAVLAEPTAVAVHAVARNLPPPESEVLVIGPGTIGLATVAALRAFVPTVRITVAGLGHFADDLATAAGADALVHGTRAELVEAAAGTLGAEVVGGRLSGPVIDAGFDVVFDAVASEQTIDDALRMTRPRGRIVVLGTAVAQKVDWTFTWYREIGIRGTIYYADEDVPEGGGLEPGRRRAMTIALELLAEAGLGPLVTHIFPLEEPLEALRTAKAGPGAEALKVTFSPDV